VVSESTPSVLGRLAAPPDAVPWGELSLAVSSGPGSHSERERRKELFNAVVSAVLQEDGPALVDAAARLMTQIGNDDSYAAYLCGAAAKHVGLLALARAYWTVGTEASRYPYCRTWCERELRGLGPRDLGPDDTGEKVSLPAIVPPCSE
jgi:hypothetical protein